MTKHKSYKGHLYKQLQNPEAVTTYLHEALKEDDIQIFLLALRDVEKARRKMDPMRWIIGPK